MEATAEILSGVLVWAGAIGIAAGATYKLLVRRSKESPANTEDSTLGEEQSR